MTRDDASTTSTTTENTTDNTADDTTDIIPTGTTVSGDVRYGAGLWQEYWNGVGNGNGDWQAARRLLELSPRVCGYFAGHLAVVLEPHDDDDRDDDDGHEPPERRRRDVTLDWVAAAGRIDADGFSSTEARLARLVAALTTGQPLELASLTWMGSWSSQVWRVLCEWGTDGRLTAAERS